MGRAENISATGRKHTARRPVVLRLLPLLTVLVLAGPVLAGFVGTVAPAFGIMPALGLYEPGLNAFRDLFAWPGFNSALRLSLSSGLGATLLSLALVTLILASLQDTKVFTLLRRLLSPLLSVPHAAAAFGLAFLIAPSGWIVRAVSPALTGWDRPPDLLILQDPMGLSLIAGLVVKEVPFLLLMAMAAMGQVQSRRSLVIARSLGYGREAAWLKAIFPRVYAQIRLPVYVVLAYSMSVVDVAVILGPNTPPPLSVQIVRWTSDPDLTLRLRAAAGALVQLGLVLASLVAWRGGEIVTAKLGMRWTESGQRAPALRALRPLAILLAGISVLAVLLGLAGLITWSFAGLWRFPDLLPQEFSLRSWLRFGPTLAQPLQETVVIAAVSTLIALVLTIGCLEAEHRHGLRMGRGGFWILYLPLLIPQVAFLPGVQTLMISLGLTSGRAAVIAVHVVFVLPYVFLSLADPFRAWDKRYATIGGALGAGADRVLWTLRLPMLLAPVLTAAAVGFAVSVGQYLPTLLVGGGRVMTLTTEAVALASGGDRRAIGVYALVQTGAALVPFALALFLPRLIWFNRKALYND
ncbi:ABC transporter permease [Candidatus Halocynthiibacter alkanivorans]|jgi:putative thiamine transport system permease protein|uniref:ABC transporter permease n=1 Tax=Candidatus Halocynthiibacter alkanivorans TaxID=2267619 RepID=UPI000DF41AC4|nr:ABC transporter permease subunit [Candidatus Halocynthiibacter alkanivorans]